MKFVIGIQARSKSIRLPGKCLMEINGKPMWRHVYDEVKDICDTFMLVPFEHEDTDMWIAVRDVPHICGPMDLPLERYQQLFEHMNPSRVIRITADCPLISRFIVMDMIQFVEANPCDFMQCELDGMDVQIISGNILNNPTFQDDEHVVNVSKIKDRLLYTKYEMHLSIDTKKQFENISRMMDRRKNTLVI